jgi:hypothetical protein
LTAEWERSGILGWSWLHYWAGDRWTTVGSRLHDEVDHHPNTRVEFPVPWDWQHSAAQPKKSNEPVKEPRLTAPVKAPEPLVPKQKQYL